MFQGLSIMFKNTPKKLLRESDLMENGFFLKLNRKQNKVVSKH